MSFRSLFGRACLQWSHTLTRSASRKIVSPEPQYPRSQADTWESTFKDPRLVVFSFKLPFLCKRVLRSLIQLGGHRPLRSRCGDGRGLIVLDQKGRREVEAAPLQQSGEMVLLLLLPPSQESAGQHWLQQEKDGLPSNRATLYTPKDIVAFNDLQHRFKGRLGIT